jgi:MoaA/NifB/PqqE/SkfB family radical SAM enzyme
VKGIVRAWGKILMGDTPNLSVEITRECPLRCPGCYAYNDNHLGGTVRLRELVDLTGQALVDGFFRLIDRYRPLHVSIVGGEPLVRYRELEAILPRLAARGLYSQVVTSAVRPIPLGWRDLPRLQIVVSVDGLPPEHDARRKPATYDRILKHIDGHRVTVHCTVTRQQAQRPGYVEEFVRVWSTQPAADQIWISLYTPQVGEVSAERLTPEDRRRVVAELFDLRRRYPKLKLPHGLIQVYAAPPRSPAECIFARTTTCVSADMERLIQPCQFGGTPDCEQCGCIASAGLAAIGRHRLGGVVPVGAIFEASWRIGRAVRAVRGRPLGPAPAASLSEAAPRP